MEGGRDALVGTGPERYRCRVASRPQMTLAVKRLIRDMVARLPELAHVKPSRILVVAGEARRASRATIRPAHFRETRARGGRGGLRKPLIRIGGRKVLYVITLRPLWFRASTPEQRVGTVLHELWHASERFDGTLHRGRVHGRLPRPRFERRIRALRDRYLSMADADVIAPFTYSGVALARMWLERPAGFYRVGEYGGRRTYTEKQLFLGLLRMKTPAAGRPLARGPSRR
jgi:predicted metallopeptidase